MAISRSSASEGIDPSLQNNQAPETREGVSKVVDATRAALAGLALSTAAYAGDGKTPEAPPIQETTRTELAGLMQEVQGSDPILSLFAEESIMLAGAEGVKGVVDFSKVEALLAYKNLPESEQAKVRQMYDMLVKDAGDNPEKQRGVQFVVLNFIMFLKSIGFNPQSTIFKAEKYLDKTVDALKKAGFGGEFIDGLETARSKAQERDRYSMELANLSPSELQARIDEINEV